MRKDQDMSQLVEALAEPVGVPVRPEWAAGIAAHYAAIARAAREVEELALDDAAEPAWRFEA